MRFGSDARLVKGKLVEIQEQTGKNFEAKYLADPFSTKDPPPPPPDTQKQKQTDKKNEVTSIMWLKADRRSLEL